MRFAESTPKQCAPPGIWLLIHQAMDRHEGRTRAAAGAADARERPAAGSPRPDRALFGGNDVAGNRVTDALVFDLFCRIGFDIGLGGGLGLLGDLGGVLRFELGQPGVVNRQSMKRVSERAVLPAALGVVLQQVGQEADALHHAGVGELFGGYRKGEPFEHVAGGSHLAVRVAGVFEIYAHLV